MEDEKLKAKRDIAKKIREDDAKTATEVIVDINGLSFDGIRKKGDKIKVTDHQKKWLLSLTPPAIKEIKQGK